MNEALCVLIEARDSYVDVFITTLRLTDYLTYCDADKGQISEVRPSI